MLKTSQKFTMGPSCVLDTILKTCLPSPKYNMRIC